MVVDVHGSDGNKWKKAITKLLHITEEQGASDLHITSHQIPRIRLHGEMEHIEGAPTLSAHDIQCLIAATMNDEQRAEYEERWELDYAISFSDSSRFRVNAFKTINGASAVFRVIPTKILSLDELKAPLIFKKLTNAKNGLILVTGPTGSGKSTTLAAMVDYINRTKNHHIITIEDPVEFVHKSKRSLVNQREVGNSTKSFANALKSALREDPDVVLVGELRDIETISLALTAAETGHIVFGTLHTNSAPQTINRIIDVFPSDDKGLIRSMLASSLQAVISQTLLKKKDGKGRIAAHEILIAIPSIRNLIREDQIAQISSVMQVNAGNGMQTMKHTVQQLVDANIIDDPNEEKRVEDDFDDTEEYEEI